MFLFFFCLFCFFFFNDTATTEIYTLSLHDALPIRPAPSFPEPACPWSIWRPMSRRPRLRTRRGRSEEHTSELSHVAISYAVFCLKKKKKIKKKKTKKKKKKKQRRKQKKK